MSARRFGPVGLAVAAAVGLVVLVAAVVLAITDDGGQVDDTGGRSGTPATESTSPTPQRETDSPSPTLRADRSPFTGLESKSPEPVLAVKIDNLSSARPHTNTDQADVVYVEPVEGGLSRLMAIFSSEQPEWVGPVRSARESDLEILRQYGKPAFAFSGANSTVLSLIEEAPVFDVSHGRSGEAYTRNDRPAPHNLIGAPEKLLADAPRASTAKDIGFRFGPAPPGGRKSDGETVSYDAFRMDVNWSRSKDRWLIDMDGSPYRTAAGVRPDVSTVVVQQTQVRASKHQALRRVGSPYVETVGSGRATVLRDGKEYDARWSRPDADSGTTFTTPDGKPLRFAPGKVWVVLDQA